MIRSLIKSSQSLENKKVDARYQYWIYNEYEMNWKEEADDLLLYDQGEFAIDALESWIGVEKVPAASCYNHQLDHHHEINLIIIMPSTWSSSFIMTSTGWSSWHQAGWSPKWWGQPCWFLRKCRYLRWHSQAEAVQCSSSTIWSQWWTMSMPTAPMMMMMMMNFTEMRITIIAMMMIVHKM